MEKIKLEITQEIETKISVIVKDITEKVYNGYYYNIFDFNKAEAYVDFYHEDNGFKKTVVIVADNINEMNIISNIIMSDIPAFTPVIQLLYEHKNGINKKSEQEVKETYALLLSMLGERLRTFDDSKKMKNYVHYLSIQNFYSFSYFEFYRFIETEFNINSPVKDKLFKYYDMFHEAGLCSTSEFEWFTVISRFPRKIHVNADDELHNVNGSACEWNWKNYFINGRKVPDWVIEEKDEESLYYKFMFEQNEDIKAAIITRIKEQKGNDGLLKFLKAELIDEQEIHHIDGYEKVQLYKTKEVFPFLQDRNGVMGQPYCWSGMTCPSTGSYYLIDNSADFTDALEAIKWLRPQFVPEHLKYEWSSRN